MTKSMVSGCIAAGLILLMANASLAQTAVSNDKGLRKQNPAQTEYRDESRAHQGS